ncbi:molecular chaperone TorD family protein [Vibrio olivae]|uniref:Molecular chaperone TorD family protein n=1 Tax=Vibrio olivae TaxID=1243002 RepID=A0ABV5HIR8_9VIBR
MSQISILPRLLGNLMFEYPSSERNQAILNQLGHIPVLFPWDNPEQIAALISTLEDTKNNLNDYAFSVLFEGQGKLIAPPWGSVYQHRENEVMGDSTEAFRLFLEHIGMNIEIGSQPCDHFAIMLWAIAYTLENEQDEALVELLEIHLLPWSNRYLSLLKSNQDSAFYAAVSELCELFLSQLQHQLQVTPQAKQLYW